MKCDMVPPTPRESWGSNPTQDVHPFLPGAQAMSPVMSWLPGACIFVSPFLNCLVVESIFCQDLTHMPLGAGRVSGVNPPMGGDLLSR